MDIPLFAADWVEGIIGVIFLLIAAVSAISNIAKEKNKGQPGKVKEKAALQKELEKFLQDAMNPQQKKKEKPAEVDIFEDVEVEPQTSAPPPPQRHRRQQSQPPQRSRSQRKQQQAEISAAVGSQEASESKSHVTHRERALVHAQEQKKRMGGGVRDRIERKQQSHMGTRLTSHLESKVGSHFAETFGSRRVQSRKSTSKTGGSKVIRAMLRNPQSFRQAIILNEILSPPKSRRHS
ncbi:hypothetical protein [uncultured Gimesia sp.]|uniref:hypothetical protein n=1 Tax=uncultured Gimesia sp. TaxID=1678688 RepID=UPI0030DD899E|tara:strand:- start:161313 stop:162020 length:708 start_codon:yes stop_codon:yes gene_type:complete